uniref:START domain-containing protein n=1 Tax=Steinernema glaseri TaxID=37863 RepID=A0A1I7Y6W2_9BILA
MTSIEIFDVKDTLAPEFEKYKQGMVNASESLKEAYEIFNSVSFATKEDWKKETEQNGDIVYSKNIKYGKLFTLSSELPLDCETVFKDNWTGIENLSQWNPNYAFSHSFKTLTDHADLIHYGNNDMMVVKGRDFVVGRMWRKIGDAFFLSGRSFETPDIPESKNNVRAVLHLGAGRFQPHPSDPTKCKVDFIMCLDFKGWIPSKVINAVMGKMMIQDAEVNKKRCEQMRDAKNA